MSSFLGGKSENKSPSAHDVSSFLRNSSLEFLGSPGSAVLLQHRIRALKHWRNERKHNSTAAARRQRQRWQLWGDGGGGGTMCLKWRRKICCYYMPSQKRWRKQAIADLVHRCIQSVCVQIKKLFRLTVHTLTLRNAIFNHDLLACSESALFPTKIQFWKHKILLYPCIFFNSKTIFRLIFHKDVFYDNFMHRMSNQ